MTTAAQREIMPEAQFFGFDALTDEACRLHDAAMAAYSGGRINKAEKLFRRSLALFEQAEGPDHPDVAAVLNNLGALLEDRCDYLAAEACYVRAAAITEAVEEDSKNNKDDQDVARLRLQS